MSGLDNSQPVTDETVLKVGGEDPEPGATPETVPPTGLPDQTASDEDADDAG
jgi:hypothetical protein